MTAMSLVHVNPSSATAGYAHRLLSMSNRSCSRCINPQTIRGSSNLLSKHSATPLRVTQSSVVNLVTQA